MLGFLTTVRNRSHILTQTTECDDTNLQALTPVRGNEAPEATSPNTIKHGGGQQEEWISTLAVASAFAKKALEADAKGQPEVSRDMYAESLETFLSLLPDYVEKTSAKETLEAIRETSKTGSSTPPAESERHLHVGNQEGTLSPYHDTIVDIFTTFAVVLRRSPIPSLATEIGNRAFRLCCHLDKRWDVSGNTLNVAKLGFLKIMDYDKQYQLHQKCIALLTTLITAFLHAVKAFQETPSPYSDDNTFTTNTKGACEKVS